MNKQQEPRLRFRDFMGAWEDRMLGKVADVRDGTHDSPIYQNQGIPLVTSKNLTENGLDFSNVSLISQEDYEEIYNRGLSAAFSIINRPVTLEEAMRKGNDFLYQAVQNIIRLLICVNRE